MLLGFIVPFISMIKPSVANMNLALNLAYAGLSLNLFKVSLTRPDEHTAKNQDYARPPNHLHSGRQYKWHF